MSFFGTTQTPLLSRLFSQPRILPALTKMAVQIGLLIELALVDDAGTSVSSICEKDTSEYPRCMARIATQT